MDLEKMSNMASTLLMRGIGLIMLMTGLLLSPCYADEVIFKNQGVQTGTVVEIGEQSVTIRFPRESIQSILMSQEGVSSPEKKEYLKSVPLTDPQVQERIKENQERIESLEENLQEDKKAAGSPTPDPSKNGMAIEQLLREEMGRVKGVILWKGRPLANGSVMIVLDRYTGFSWASLKKMFSKNEEKSSDQGITLTMKTDSQGRYIFEEAPPGKYRLYLLPNAETGWVRRLAEKPDFEVITGELTIHNVPGEKK